MTDMDKLITSIMKEAEKDGEPVTREEAKEMAEMEIKAKSINRYEQSEKPRKKAVKERKVDEQKLEIINALNAAVAEFADGTASVKNEAEVSFICKGVDYTVKLIKHRPPKKTIQ